jgi:predicted nucleic acid-binding protein
MGSSIPPARLFLDANVIFSAALGGESFTQLWSARRQGLVTFCTSPQCVDEARRNLTLKKPHALARLELVFLEVEVIDAPLAVLSWTEGKIPEDDAWVVAAAVGSGARVLLTGNTRHFGWMMTRDDLPIRVRTVRAWLDEQSGGQQRLQ